ncbi:MAG: hypothetical protein P1U68_15600 [Verrucomicrobiales bacterium]|nr:hypothetical protein [Verrucomicrobiales bacterium]
MVSFAKYSLVTALLVSFLLSSVQAETKGALPSLKAFVSSQQFKKDEVVLGMVGFYGDPRPPQWLILTGSLSEKGVLRESVFSGGKVVAERSFKALKGQDLPSLPINPHTVKFDSGDSFEVAEKVAIARRISFETVHYQLRCRAEGSEPVWMLSLINPSQVVVGVVYVSAVTGELLEESWPTLRFEKFSSAR